MLPPSGNPDPPCTLCQLVVRRNTAPLFAVLPPTLIHCPPPAGVRPPDGQGAGRAVLLRVAARGAKPRPEAARGGHSGGMCAGGYAGEDSTPSVSPPFRHPTIISPILHAAPSLQQKRGGIHRKGYEQPHACPCLGDRLGPAHDLMLRCFPQVIASYEYYTMEWIQRQVKETAPRKATSFSQMDTRPR